MSNFNSFVQSILDCVKRQNGMPSLTDLISSPRSTFLFFYFVLANPFLPYIYTTGRQIQSLLDINSPEAQSAVMNARSLNPRWSPAGACNRLPEGWAEFITLHCACLGALQEGNRSDAYDRAVSALQPFLRVFREDESAWVIFPMHNVVHNLRAIAEAADSEARTAGRRADKLADCGDQLRKCFSVSLQAPGNKEKKAAALDIVNVSIKIYFKLNTLRLCKNLIRTVESKQFPPFDSFPISQRVTYKFYMGRLAVFDDSYVSLKKTLSLMCIRGLSVGVSVSDPL